LATLGLPVITGLTARTLLPVPVLVTETSPLEASVATADDAVNEDMTGCAVKVATPVIAAVVATARVLVDVSEVAVIAAGRVTLPVKSPTKPLVLYTGPWKWVLAMRITPI
jgi:hypothetical protein